MPLLTKEEFEQILPANTARSLCADAGSFVAAEKAATQELVTLSGLTEPAAVADAPAW